MQRKLRLITILCLIFQNYGLAQTFTTLHNFAAGSGYPSYTNSDGSGPGGLLLSGNTLYGTTGLGGNFANGTIFRINVDGSGFATLHTFTKLSAPYYTNDGAFAEVSFLLGNTLYGIAHQGGPLQAGTIFAMNTDGTGFANLYNFNNGPGFPFALISLGNIFYGAASGGSSYGGTLFAVSTNGTGFSLLHDFAPMYYNSTINRYTNSDGTYPAGGLFPSGNVLYGAAYEGGFSDQGTVYKVSADGSGFEVLHSFTATEAIARTNEDGANPLAGVILSDNVIYGAAMNGGSSGDGALFKVNSDGTGFMTLHNFTPLGLNTNSDGAQPARLVVSGTTLYGTTWYGGRFGYGTVFAVSTDGSDFATLHHFRRSDGAAPSVSLVLSNTLYGTTSQGGSSDNGTVFSLSLPRLAISCPQSLILECTNGVAVGTLDLQLEYSSSQPVLVLWTIDGTPYETNNLPPVGILTSKHLTSTVDFATGEHLITVSASNGGGLSGHCSFAVKVQDTSAPVILSVLPTPDLLWPPNDQMVSVTIEVHAMDNCGPTSCKIVAITSNQATNSPGLKDALDWVITSAVTADLRAKRAGNGGALVYTIWIECVDLAGNSSLSSVNVTVPHDHR